MLVTLLVTICNLKQRTTESKETRLERNLRSHLIHLLA